MAWPSGLSAGLVIRRPRVQVPLLTLAGFVHGSHEFKSWTTLVNSQLVYLPPVGILNPVKVARLDFFRVDTCQV